MKNVIENIREKIKMCSDSTKENRARKGAYVDCLVIIEQAEQNVCDNSERRKNKNSC